MPELSFSLVLLGAALFGCMLRRFLRRLVDASSRSVPVYVGSSGVVSNLNSPRLGESLAILAGQSAIEANQGSITPTQINAARPTHLIYDGGVHTFTGHSLRFERAIPADSSSPRMTMLDIRLPILNHAQVGVLEQYMNGGLYPDTLNLSGTTINLWDPIQGSYATPWTVPLDRSLLNHIDTGISDQQLLNGLADRLREDLFHEQIYTNMQVVITLLPIDPLHPPPGGGNRLLRFGAIAGEFALGFVPGWDLVDVVKEGFWKPVILGEPSTEGYIIAGVAFFGLLADAGYLAGPVGLATNAATSSLKTLVKRMPPGTRRALLRVGKTGVDSAKLLVGYLRKVPKPPGMSYAEWAGRVVMEVERKWTRVLSSPIGLSEEELIAAIRVSHARTATRLVNDEATEGIAAFVKHGAGGEESISEALGKVAGQLGDEAADAATEGVAQAFGRTYRNGLPGGSVADAKAVARVDDAVEAVQHTLSPRNRATIASLIGENHVIKSMEEFEALRFLRAENLTSDQVAAIKAIRAAIPEIDGTTAIRKVISPSHAGNYVNGVWPDAEIGGFISKADDVQDILGRSRSEVRDALRLDYANGPLEGTGGYAVIEIDAPTLEIVANARTPKSTGFWSGGNDRLIEMPGYPYSGNGFTTCKDGHLRPEFSLSAEPLGNPGSWPSQDRFAMPLGSRIRKYSDAGQEVGLWELVVQNGERVWVAQ